MFMKHINLKRSFGLFVLCCLLPLTAMAQQVTVKGTVTDQNGEPSWEQVLSLSLRLTV